MRWIDLKIGDLIIVSYTGLVQELLLLDCVLDREYLRLNWLELDTSKTRTGYISLQTDKLTNPTNKTVTVINEQGIHALII